MHSLFEAIPFLGVILSLSFLPLINQEFWHKNSKNVFAFWILLYVVIESANFGGSKTAIFMTESVLKHYIPFVLLVASLYITTGGIFVDFHKLKHGPVTNALFLLGGSIVAGWIGTTGASALLIRPFLRLNEGRKHKVHLVLFFIFLISNIGGVASPIGDPPIFMGYLEGVDFFWFIKNLFWYLTFTMLSVIAIFYCIDSYFWKKYDSDAQVSRPTSEQHITVLGKRNIVLLFAILLCLVFCNFDGGFSVVGIPIKHSSVLRDGLLIIISVLSIKLSSGKERKRNGFSYAPIIEVAETFLAIFITVSPILNMLSVGKEGPLGFVFSAISPNGSLDIFRCFWIVGGLSMFLDNAPSFLIFFYLAGGDAANLMTENARYLVAISLNAVFMGAMTYIGNAPNLMMRSIAEASGIRMPTFIGYMLASFIVLIPIFFILSLML